MKFRPHKGSFADSTAEMVEVDDGRAGLIAHMRKELAPFPQMDDFEDSAVHVEPYGGPDPRIGWEGVYIVTLDGYGVIGFVDKWNSD